ncbi:MAG: hypothetical protein ACHQT8_02170 [Chlamydiales bacterium]
MKWFFLRSSDQKFAETRSSVTTLPYPYAEIGKGSLSLNAARPSQFIPWLGSELVLLGCNTRPDNSQMVPTLLLGLKGIGEERVGKIGENIFLQELEKEKEGRKAVQFSALPTALSVKPVSLGKNSVTLEMSRIAQDTQVEEKTQFLLQKTRDGLKRTFSLHQKEEAAFAKAMKGAKHWGKDRFLDLHGGEGYRYLKEREKVQFNKEGGNYVCFVRAGDILLWQDEKWRVANPDEILTTSPIAQVKIATPRAVEIEMWDETGFYHLAQKMDAQSASRQQGKETTLFSSIRLRNNSAVTCVAGKRRILLREGDWLLKTPSGWRNLRTAQQIEDCVEHRLIGELFICEGVELVQGKPYLKGQLFDEMRTQVQPISLAISQEKKSSKSRERRSKR